MPGPPLVQRIQIIVSDQQLKKLRGDMRTHSRETAREVAGMGRNFDGLGGKIKGVIGGAAVAAFALLTGGIVRATRALYEHGTNAEETAAKYATILGPAIGTANTFIAENARLMGMSDRVAQEFLSTAAAILQGMGATQQQSADMGAEVLRLAASIQSMHNVPIEETFNAIRSGLVGEVEPMRRFGADISVSALKLRGITEDSSQFEKAQARLALMYQQLGVAIDDHIRTQDSTQNRARQVRAEFEQLRDEFARGTLPAYGALIDAGRRLLGVMQEQNETVGPRLAAAFVSATQYAVDLAVNLGRVGQAALTLINAIGILDAGGTGGLFSIWLQKWQEDLRGFAAMINGTSVAWLEFRAIYQDFRADVQDRLGLKEAAEQNRKWAQESRDAAEAIRETMRQQRAADIESKRERERLAADLKKLQEEGVAPGAPLAPPAAPLVPVDPKALAAAEKAFQKIREALEIAALPTFAEDARKAMSDVFAIKKQIAELDEIAAKKGEAAVRAQREQLETALAKAQARLAVETALAERIKAAADSLNHMATRFILRSPAGEGAFGFTERVEDLVETRTRDGRTERRIRDTALRTAGMTDDEAKVIEEAIERINKKLEAGGTSAQQMAEAFQNIGSSLRSVTRLVDVFGDLPDHTRQFLDGLADSVDNAGRLVEQIEKVRAGTADFQSLLVPGVGAVAGIATALFGFAQSYNAARQAEREAAEQLAREQREALRDNTRALQEFRQNLFAGGRVGAGVSGTQAEEAARLSEEALSWIARLDGLSAIEDDNERLAAWMEIVEEAATRLQQIDALGIEGFDNFYERFLELSETLGYSGALQALMEGSDGLTALFAMLSEEIGDFTADIEGAGRQFRILTDIMGVEMPEAFRAWIDFLLANVEGLSDEMQALLTEGATLDLSTAEGRARAAEIGRLIAQGILSGGAGFLGGLTPEQAEQIAEMFMQGSQFAPTAGNAGEFTRSVQIARSITEIQASELVALTEEQLFALREGNAALRDILAGIGQANTHLAARSAADVVEALMRQAEMGAQAELLRQILGFVRVITAHLAPTMGEPVNIMPGGGAGGGARGDVGDRLRGLLDHLTTAPALPAGMAQALAVQNANAFNVTANVTAPRPLEYMTDSEWDAVGRRIGKQIADQVRAKAGRGVTISGTSR